MKHHGLSHVALVFERDARRAGKQGGVVHFGFRLVEPVPVATVVRDADPG